MFLLFYIFSSKVALFSPNNFPPPIRSLYQITWLRQSSDWFPLFCFPLSSKQRARTLSVKFVITDLFWISLGNSGPEEPRHDGGGDIGGLVHVREVGVHVLGQHEQPNKAELAARTTSTKKSNDAILEIKSCQNELWQRWRRKCFENGGGRNWNGRWGAWRPRWISFGTSGKIKFLNDLMIHFRCFFVNFECCFDPYLSLMFL